MFNNFANPKSKLKMLEIYAFHYFFNRWQSYHGLFEIETWVDGGHIFYLLNKKSFKRKISLMHLQS
jgi:hypothetical protein